MNNLIDENMIFLDLEANDKQEVIEKLAKVIELQDRLYDLKGYINQVNIREGQFPTAVGFDFAIPHGKTEAVKEAALAFARLKTKVKWSEEEEAKYVFLIAVPEKEAGDKHLQILAQISRRIMREEFRQQIEDAKNVQEVLQILNIS